MSLPTDSKSDLPLYEPTENATYSLEIAARIVGVKTETIMQYKDQGLVRISSHDSEAPLLNDEAIRTLRRIEHLRDTCGVNETGLHLILELTSEIEQLRNHLRSRR